MAPKLSVHSNVPPYSRPFMPTPTNTYDATIPIERTKSVPYRGDPRPYEIVSRTRVHTRTPGMDEARWHGGRGLRAGT